MTLLDFVGAAMHHERDRQTEKVMLPSECPFFKACLNGPCNTTWLRESPATATCTLLSLYRVGAMTMDS
jgi:hypothetical protein